MISNSGKDERGRYIGGQAGDQTGAEWHIIPWYNRPWDCILRHPDAKVRKKIADLAIKAANNNKIGYDQNQRTTFWDQLKKVNYDPAKITTACEADCSAGVCSIIKAVGYLLGIKKLQSISITTTHYMRNMLKNAGFEVLTDKKYLTSDEYLLAGDILLNEQHHTATNVTDGKKAVAPKPVEKRKYSGELPTLKNGKAIKNGDKGEEVGKLQRFLNWYGNYKLATDNKCGPLTTQAIRKFQQAEGIEVDGRFGPDSRKTAAKYK